MLNDTVEKEKEKTRKFYDKLQVRLSIFFSLRDMNQLLIRLWLEFRCIIF